jgi:hypothetical protein
VPRSGRRALDAGERGAANRACCATPMIRRANRPRQERRRRSEERAAEDGGERRERVERRHKRRWAREGVLLGLESHTPPPAGCRVPFVLAHDGPHCATLLVDPNPTWHGIPL